MAKKKKKEEALLVTRFIQEVLVNQLGIPYKQIVNDKTFTNYTMLKRADLLISNVAYDLSLQNEDEYINHLIAYAEVKDKSTVGSSDWIDGYNQGLKKSKMLKIPYFIVTNCKVAYFYNANTGNEIKLNGNPIRNFPEIDILQLIINRLKKNYLLDDITTTFEIQSKITEGVFNAKLWTLADIYRQLDFKNSSEKIDFTIGMIALKYFEEKEEYMGVKSPKKSYWSDVAKKEKDDEFTALLTKYIERLEQETEFQEFKSLMSICLNKIKNLKTKQLRDIFFTIESIGHLHGCGFDLFGAVYEMFASNKEKSDFGEFFTRRHYTKIFSKLLLKNEDTYSDTQKFTILDPACGTGGFLTEAFKVLKNNYKDSGTLNKDSLNFLQKECIYGIDVKDENISRAKLNMFLVGDGHTNIIKEDSLLLTLDESTQQTTGVLERKKWNKFKYILSNPPYGNGKVNAESQTFNSTRYEVAFMMKIISMLEVGGRACVILPDGCLENPTMINFRKEVLQLCKIEAIISLPKFAFAPYTKEKTYALYIKKKSSTNTKIQQESIWMYIIDNDGYANSDKRFPTKLKHENGSWLHDELSTYFNINTGTEELGLLESRWLTFDDSGTNGTQIYTEKGDNVRLRKGGFININKIANNDTYFNLLPEYHLRKLEPDYISLDEVEEDLVSINQELIQLLAGDISDSSK